MRFSVVTIGTEGDTRPLAILCRGLLDRGHEVKLFADHGNLTLPRALGVPCEALQGDFKSLVPGGDQGKAGGSPAARPTGKSFIADNVTAWLRAVAEHATGSDVIMFGSFGQSVAAILQGELNKPVVRLAFPPLTPTREFASVFLTGRQLPGWLNPWTYKLFDFLTLSTYYAGAAKARLEVFGTKGAWPSADIFPTLYAISRELVARPADWPQDHVICGHWHAAMNDWQPPQELLDFLGDQPPLYVGFGSMAPYVTPAVLKAIVAAVAGRRVVFSQGWGNVDRSVLPDNFFIVRNVPNEWLFPRVSLAVHHGGAGTTHSAARAGVPQVILPVAGDQFFWAARLAALGVAPKTSRRAAADAAAVAKMIAFAELPSTQQKARELGQAVAREDGVQVAVRWLEALGERHAAARSAA